MEPWIQFLGRLHPMVLHAPIGLLIGLVAIESAALASRRPLAPSVRAVLSWLTALSAIVAAASGWLLSREGGYDGPTVQWHQWLGIGVAAVAIAAAVLQHLGYTAAFRALLVIAAGAAVPAGHLGASMTHGPDYLTEPFAERRTPDPVDRTPSESPPAVAAAGPSYSTVIAPIFESRCVSCHSRAKHKGGLALDSPESIALGGDLGSVTYPDDSGQSELARRLRLPPEDEEHMPPASKPQLAEAEIAAIEAWLNAGASFDAASGTSPDRAAGGDPSGTEPRTPDDAGVEPAAPAAVAALRDRLVYVAPASQGSALLVVDFAAVADGISEQETASLLTPVVEQVSDLSLARTPIGDGLMPLIARMPHLTRLNLTATRITDTGLAQLQGCPALRELIVAQTALTDAAVPSLLSMPALRSVFGWKSSLTAQGVEPLLARSVVVDLGDPRSATVLEADAQVTLSTDAPPPAPGLQPINSVCPVSGTAVDPDYAIVFKGRIIGFCCEHCPTQFWADPAKFEAALPR